MRNLLLALFFVQAAAAKNGTAIKKFQMNCDSIKCPTTENPVCVKLKYDGKNQKDLYIVAVNECEINYAKCKPGIEAVIVPMKNCEHDFKTSKKVLTRKKRIKRQLTGSDGEGTGSDVYNQKLTGHFINNRHSAEEDDDYDEENNDIGIDNEYGDDENDDDDIEYGDDENNNNVDDGNNERGDSEYYDDKYVGNDNNDDERNDGDDDDYEEYSDDTMTYAKLAAPYPNKQEIEYEDKQETEQDEDKQEIEQDEDKQEIEQDEDTIIAADPDYDNTGENEVNFVEYKDTCPKECPARRVMVCARCQHNIHRTFLSVCHLRMFSCQHPDEKLELVVRKPCMQSSPYLADLPTAKATLQDPGDEDQVLKFIHCRDRGRFERDPRCEFR